MERGGHEEEAGSPPGEHVKPHELLQQNMDSKTLHLYAQAVNLNQTHPPCFTVTGSKFQIPTAYVLFYKVMLLLFIVLWFPS